MTNLRISYPDIPFQAATITPSAAFSEEYALMNLVTGERWTMGALASSSGDALTISFNLGANFTTKGATADHCIIARADLLSSVSSFSLYSSTNNLDWNPIFESEEPSGSSGPAYQDWITTFAESSQFRYWLIEYACAEGSSIFMHSKLYLGKFWTPSTSPAYQFERILGSSSNMLGSGARFFRRTATPHYRFTMTWSNLSTAEITTFQNKIYRYANTNPVFLHTVGVHDILNDEELVHCWVVSARVNRKYHNKNDLEVIFEEIIG